MRRSEQTFDLPLVSNSPLVSEKCIYFGNGRRQSNKVQAQAAEQCRPVRLGRRLQLLFFQPCQNERINRVASPSVLLHFGDLRTRRCLESPMSSPIFSIGNGGFRPISALIDPGSEQADLFVAKRIAFFW